LDCTHPRVKFIGTFIKIIADDIEAEMSTIGTIQKPARQAQERPAFVLDPSAIAIWLWRASERRRTRRALLSLNDEQLKDIGLSRSQAFAEAVRPFWE
jgi:uncharacterized protein YjiS (DUF1127 family)